MKKKSFKRKTKTAAKLGLIGGITALLSSCGAFADTPYGIDTQLVDDLLFAVKGQQVGDWTRSSLSVTGGIRTGIDSDDCSAANEGTQRYNFSVHGYEFCNATEWTPLGGSASGSMCGMVWWDTQFGDVGIRVPCQGHLVASTYGSAPDCPAGYTAQVVGEEHDDAGEWHAFTSCIKN